MINRLATNFDAQSSISSPAASTTDTRKTADQDLLPTVPCLKTKPESKSENLKPRLTQNLGALEADDVIGHIKKPATNSKIAIENLFVCESKLTSLLILSVPENSTLKNNIDYLFSNKIRINLSRKNQDKFDESVHKLLNEKPMALKFVLSHESDKNKPSIYVKTDAKSQFPEIVYVSNHENDIPLNDLDFALGHISKWRKNNKVWPSVYAYFQAPKDVSPELISGIDKMPISNLTNRGDVCDLSKLGFKPYHGPEDGPKCNYLLNLQKFRSKVKVKQQS